MNQDLPIISVIVITYKQAAFIEQTLEGIFSQVGNFKIELIIGDDNSPDDTEKIVHKFVNLVNHVSILYVKHPTNKGVLGNLLWALNECSGDYIAICEGDDYWSDSRKLEKQINILTTQKNVSAVYSAYLILDDGQLTYYKSEFEGKQLVTNTTIFSICENIWEGSFLLGQTATLCFRATKGIKEDMNLNLKRLEKEISPDKVLQVCLMNKGRLAYMDDSLSVYRKHAGGVSFNLKKNKSDQLKELLLLRHIATSFYCRRMIKTKISLMRFFDENMRLKMIDLFVVSIHFLRSKKPIKPILVRLFYG